MWGFHVRSALVLAHLRPYGGPTAAERRPVRGICGLMVGPLQPNGDRFVGSLAILIAFVIHFTRPISNAG
jgi:hypothetical protein